jgi:hypothetical protein
MLALSYRIYGFALTKQLPVPSSALLRCSYHCSRVDSAKARKSNESVTSAAEISLPPVRSIEPGMDNILSKLVLDMSKQKIGKISTETFSQLNVNSFGSIGSLGQLTMKTPTKLSISVFDPSIVKQVADAIKDSGLGLNPTVEAATVVVNIPKPSIEARETVVKLVNKMGEKVIVNHYLKCFKILLTFF